MKGSSEIAERFLKKLIAASLSLPHQCKVEAQLKHHYPSKNAAAKSSSHERQLGLKPRFLREESHTMVRNLECNPNQ